jgi:hypothetical protein
VPIFFEDKTRTSPPTWVQWGGHYISLAELKMVDWSDPSVPIFHFRDGSSLIGSMPDDHWEGDLDDHTETLQDTLDRYCGLKEAQ